MIEMHPVRSAAEKRRFYRFAFRVYRDDPNWVPHLWPGKKAYLDRRAAFFSYGEGEFWMALDGHRLVGTLGTAVNHSRNREMGWKAGIFGFFEVLPGRYDAACAMWDFARDWCRTRGLDELQGPYSFSGEDDHGFLVQGFDTSPSIMMGHNPPCYPQYAERYGFTKMHENQAYRFDLESIDHDLTRLPAAVHAIAARCLARHGQDVVRTPRMKDWENEVDRLWAVYNRAMDVLPEASATELSEFRAQANALKSVIDPQLVLIAELDGQAVGFALGLPNLSEALRHAHGLRHPWDYLRLALARRRIRSASFKILAIDPAFWGYGLESVLFLRMGQAVLERGYTWIDASLTGEANPQTNRLLQRSGAYVYRRYREYHLKL
jgi:GNAT superfamily N-acetyltransferase